MKAKTHRYVNGTCSCGWSRSGKKSNYRYRNGDYVTPDLPICTRTKVKVGLYKKDWYARTKELLKVKRLFGIDVRTQRGLTSTELSSTIRQQLTVTA